MPSLFFSLLLVGLGLSAGACAGPAAPPVFDRTPLVPVGSPFHGVHGLRFDVDDTLYATSVIGRSIFSVDTESGALERVVGPPEGMADDMAIGLDGTFVWTAIEDGIVYARAPGGPVRRLMEDRRGVNAVSFSPDGQRLFVTLVFYGDALYELDLSGEAPPRLVREDLGGLNAFEVAPDGFIYGPLVFGGRVVRVDPDTGEMTTVSDAFEQPGALKLASATTAFVLDETGEGPQVKHVDLGTGETRVVVTLPYGADNLAIDSGGRVFVSLSEVNAIVEVDPDTGQLREVVAPAPLTMPLGLAVRTEGGHDTVYVGDGFGGLRTIDGETGAIEDTPVDVFMPAHVSIAGDRLIVSGEVLFGPIQRLQLESFEVLGSWDGFDGLRDVIETSDGDLIAAESGTGRLWRLTGPEADDREVILDGLDGPTGLARAEDGGVYLTETVGGRLLRVDPATGDAAVIASELQQPEGVAVRPDGTIVVVEVAARRVTLIDPADGSTMPIASDLPLGLANGSGLYRGVATGASAIYVTSDIENTVYKLTPRP